MEDLTRFHLDLYRDGPTDTWGFRLKGGTDVDGGTPLEIVKVFVGSGSEGVLQAGDKILSINNQDTSNLSHLDAQNLFRKSGTKAQLEIGRVGSPPSDRQTPQAAAGMLQPQLEDQQKLHNQAKSVLTNHLQTLIQPTSTYPSPSSQALPTPNSLNNSQSVREDRQDGGPLQSQPYRTLPLVTPDPKTIHDAGGVTTSETVRHSALIDHSPASGVDSHMTVPAYMQPYRTTPLVLSNPRTIHDVGDAEKKYATTASNLHKNTDNDKPYRTATCLLPGPKTINEAGIGAPTYQPYRGPQYNTLVQPKVMINQDQTTSASIAFAPENLVQTGGQYNSPRPLYSDENAANTPPHPGFVQSNKLHLPSSNQGTVSKPQQSETFKIVLESEMGGAQNQPGVVGKQFEKAAFIGERPSSQLSDKPKGVDPVMKNTSINQSASFKKVMYSVMGESEF